MARFPAAFRPPAFASRAILRPPRNSAFLTVDPPDTARTSTGLSRSARARCDRIGRPLHPGTAVLSWPHQPLRPAPAASQRPVLLTRYRLPPCGLNDDEAQRGFTHVRPPDLPLTCSPRVERGPLGLNPGLRTPQLPATHARAGTGHRALTWDYTTDTSRPPWLSTYIVRPRVARRSSCYSSTTTSRSARSSAPRTRSRASTAELVREFASLLTHRRGKDLHGWMTAAENADPPALHVFVRGLRKDLPAVVAGLTLPYSNGSAEGVNTKVKYLKRQMYGRAGFPLLRRRILLC
jgi:hypothetical protein